MSEKEEWISAASALSLLGIEYWLGTSTICKRAHAGLIQARAERFIHDERVFDNVDIPAKFWWAEGSAPLNQNWTIGDFDTWVGRGIDAIHLQAFGVTFRRSDIEKSKPRPLVENAAFPAVSLSIEDINDRAASKIMEVVGTPEEASRSAEAEPDDLGTVFISYTHESPDHAQAVLDLSKRLRDEGIDCVLDRYEASPPEGWPQWMDREIKKAQFVLMICTEAYYNRVMGKEKPGIGLGIAWEGNLIYNHIYDDGSRNTRFIPVLRDEAHEQYIPTPIKGATRYYLSRPDGYEQLYGRLIGLPPAEKPPLGKRRALPKREVKTTFLGASNEHEREVDALTKVIRHFHDVLGYLQSMTRAYRLGVEVSTEEYWHLCEKAVATARETFFESRLFIPRDLVQKYERFITSVVEAQMNYAHARHPDTIDGHQRAEFWDRARKIAYEEAPVILQQIEEAARIVVSRHGELPRS